MNIDEKVTKYQDELAEHPAMKFANDAIVLAAVRSGTKGYEGEQHLGHFIEKVVREVDAQARLELFELIHKKFMNSNNKEVLDTLEELQKEIL